MNISKGRIAVYNDRDRLLYSKIYYTSEGMKKIMGEFMQEPGAYYITVRPYDTIEKKKVVYRLPVCHDPIMSDEVKQKLIRPPAIYDNNGKSLYK